MRAHRLRLMMFLPDIKLGSNGHEQVSLFGLVAMTRMMKLSSSTFYLGFVGQGVLPCCEEVPYFPLSHLFPVIASYS